MATKTPTWMDTVEIINTDLERIKKRLIKLRDSAAALKVASEPEPGASEDARFECRRARDSVETAAEIVANVARQVAAAVSNRSDREREDRALMKAQERCRASYFADVREVAEEFVSMWNAGKFSSREDAIEWIDQSVDGSGRVMYTGEAMDCLRYSDNDGAYVEEFGAEGIVKDGDINWFTLAYSAFRADIMEHIDVDMNEDPPEQVTDHKFRGTHGDECEHPLDEADENGDATEATSEVCGKAKALHKE